MYSFQFHYDRRGHGDLILRKDQERHQEWACRTGSIERHDHLINAIEPGMWKILDKPVWTRERAMVIGGIGWKARLYTPDGEYSHYLIHPDGNQPGSAGCLVTIGSAALCLKKWIETVLKEQQQIIVEILKSKTA